MKKRPCKEDVTSSSKPLGVRHERLAVDPPALPRIIRQHAFDVFQTLRIRRVTRGRRDREDGVADPWSLAHEREAGEISQHIGQLIDRYSYLTSHEEAAALLAFMMSIAQDAAGPNRVGRKRQKFPDIEEMRIGGAYEISKRDNPNLDDAEWIRRVVELVRAGDVPLSGIVASETADIATIEKRVRRALSRYKNRRAMLG